MISILFLFLGLAIHQFNLEVDKNPPDDIDLIQAQLEVQEPTILPEKDPEDVISNEMPTVAAESSSEMTEEEEGEENMFLVEGLPRNKAFRDGYLLVYAVRDQLNVYSVTECFIIIYFHNTTELRSDLYAL